MHHAVLSGRGEIVQQLLAARAGMEENKNRPGLRVYVRHAVDMPQLMRDGDVNIKHLRVCLWMFKVRSTSDVFVGWRWI